MNKPLLKNVLIVVLLTITAFSVFKYTLSLKEKYDLFIALNQAREELTVLEQEKQNLLVDLEKQKGLQEMLSEENSEFKDNLKATRRRLTKLFREIREKQNAMDELNYRFSILQAEKVALTEEKEQLNLKLSQANSENEGLKVRLGSLAELKKAIRELKIKMREAIRESKKPQDIIVEGNRGFIIKDGKSTFPFKIRIEVNPASTTE
jgi:chromosome segregation ATPase